MGNLGQHLKWLREQADLTQQQVADEFGVNREAVANWERGKNLPEASRLDRLATLYRVTVDQLLGRLAMEEPTAGRAYVVSPSRVVLRGIAHVRDAGYVSLEENQGDAETMVRWPTNDADAYALEVRGDALRPEIAPGSVLIVEPNTTVDPGRRVVAVLADGRQLIRRLGWRRNGQVELQPLGPGAPITLPESEIAALHRIVGVADDDTVHPAR
jgi:transcriptional regulator with XRE-family HTH domain